MNWLDEFTNRMRLNGKSLSEEINNNTQYILNESFADSPTYKLIKHKNIDIPTRVVSASAKNGWSKYSESYRKVIFQDRSYVCDIGEYLSFDNKDWLVIDKENVLGNSVVVEKCNNTLSFLNSSNVKLIIPCIISNLTLYSDGLSVDKVSTLPDGKRSVVISNTEDTSKLKIGQRFIFNNSDTNIFSVSLIDDFSMPGIITLTLIQEQKQSGDDLTSNIAANNQEVNDTWHF